MTNEQLDNDYGWPTPARKKMKESGADYVQSKGTCETCGHDPNDPHERCPQCLSRGIEDLGECAKEVTLYRCQDCGLYYKAYRET